ncbi:MFS transporter [Cerasicoccus maritimus]|uniref:MFS transporter n=1 Tax=Cerasicoccus maritimus TaxID=490089 RepID=UPI0028528470|nr:MFS transporter [Cerasicoccus maritimus]
MGGFSSDESQVEGPGGLRAWLVWGTAALFYLYEFFVRVAPSVMEAELQASFHLTAGALGGVLGVYFYIYAPMQLVVGPALDRFSAKTILVPACFLCAIGCIMVMSGHSDIMLGLARLCQGFGSAFAFVGTMYLAAEWFPRHRLALLSGLTTSLGMLGAIVGNAGIAEVVNDFGWRITMKDAGFFGLFVMILIFVIVPHHPPHKEAKPKVKKKGALHGLKIVVLNPQTWLTSIVTSALYMPLSVIGALWGVQYIMSLTGESKVAASGAVSMLYVGWLIGGPAVGWLSEHLGHRRLLLGASSALTVAGTGLLLIFTSMSMWSVYALMLVIGLVSCPQVIGFVVAVEHNPREYSGTSIAVTNMMVMLLGGLGMALFGVVLDWSVGTEQLGANGHYSVDAYRRAMAMLPIFAAIGGLAAWLLQESIDRDEHLQAKHERKQAKLAAAEEKANI